MSEPFKLENVKIYQVYDNSIAFDKKDLKIPDGVKKTVYLSKFVEQFKDKKPTDEKLKKDDICDLILKINGPYINVVAYNITGHESSDSLKTSYFDMF